MQSISKTQYLSHHWYRWCWSGTDVEWMPAKSSGMAWHTFPLWTARNLRSPRLSPQSNTYHGISNGSTAPRAQAAHSGERPGHPGQTGGKTRTQEWLSRLTYSQASFILRSLANMFFLQSRSRSPARRDRNYDDRSYNERDRTRSPEQRDRRERTRDRSPRRSNGNYEDSRAPRPARSTEERQQAKGDMLKSVSESSQQDRRVYVGNLSYDVKWHHLKDHMRKDGTLEVIFADVLLLPNGMSKGCGYARNNHHPLFTTNKLTNFQNCRIPDSRPSTHRHRAA